MGKLTLMEWHERFEDPRWPECDQAYDGSTTPQRGELTPKERDILTRVIHDIIWQLRVNNGDPQSLRFVNTQSDGPANGVRIDQESVDALVRALGVLDPRQG